MSRRGATELRGVLAVDKPAGMTSHDVVARIRRITGEGRVGHAGTLDPAATGLLVVLIGPYTRLEPYLASAEKSYEARIAWGSETDTDDAEGALVRTADVPDGLFEPERAHDVLSALVGPALQTPPAFSAVKVAGRVAHREARAGSPLELEPRPIEVFEATLLAADATERTWDVFFRVSKGTYVRSLARDLGRAQGSAAHLAALRRTASGALTLADAHTLDEVETAMRDGQLASVLTDPLRALALPTVDVAEGSTATGAPLASPAGTASPSAPLYAITEAGALRAIYRAAGGSLVAATVLPRVGAA